MICLGLCPRQVEALSRRRIASGRMPRGLVAVRSGSPANSCTCWCRSALEFRRVAWRGDPPPPNRSRPTASSPSRMMGGALSSSQKSSCAGIDLAISGHGLSPITCDTCHFEDSPLGRCVPVARNGHQFRRCGCDRVDCHITALGPSLRVPPSDSSTPTRTSDCFAQRARGRIYVHGVCLERPPHSRT